MKIEYIGHSCFRFTSEEGDRLLIDPFTPSALKPIPRLDADVVLVSHDHDDHNWIEMVKSRTTVITNAGSHNIRGFDISGFLCEHYRTEDKWSGMVVCFKFEIDRIVFLHLSDMGCPPSDLEIKAFGDIDVLFVPVGGYFTMDYIQAKAIADKINPRVTIPMHYASAGTDREKFPISDINPFISQYENVKTIRARETEIKLDTLPVKTETWVMTPWC
jgi:L-ascorbate metabolism protein UlaG (beta-lactamase superfamily)